MGRFGNEYLAESAGYSAGISKGAAEGLKAGIVRGKATGYTEGWNAAILECNPMIEARDAEIERLTNEIYKGNAYIAELRAALEKASHVRDLYHAERDELNALYEAEKEKCNRLQYLVFLAKERGVNIEDFDK